MPKRTQKETRLFPSSGILEGSKEQVAFQPGPEEKGNSWILDS